MKMNSVPLASSVARARHNSAPGDADSLQVGKFLKLLASRRIDEQRGPHTRLREAFERVSRTGEVVGVVS